MRIVKRNGLLAMVVKAGVSAGRLAAILVVAAFLACQPAYGAPAAPAGDVVIVTPPDNSVIEGALVDLTLRVKKVAVDELQVSVNGRRVPIAGKRPERYMACLDGIALSTGLNTIKVVGLKEGSKVAEAASRVYCRSRLSPDDSGAPDGFTRYLFHSYDQEKVCTPCHQLEFGGFDASPTPPEKSPCYRCHKKLLSGYAVQHGPSAVWSCLGCHDQKATPKLAVPTPDSNMCNNCHENSWMNMKYAHGPTAAGSCATCHDPHASDYPFFLRAPAGDVCLGCHEEVLRKPHVTAGFSNTGHPVRKAPDSEHPKRVLTCVSCHNPHAGASPTFLQNYDGTSPLYTFCRTCHRM